MCHGGTVLTPQQAHAVRATPAPKGTRSVVGRGPFSSSSSDDVDVVMMLVVVVVVMMMMMVMVMMMMMMTMTTKREEEEGEEEEGEERRRTRGAVSSKRGPNTTGWLGEIKTSDVWESRESENRMATRPE